MITTDFLADLKSILSKEQVIETENESHPLGNTGKVTVFPKSEGEIAKILAYASENAKTVSVAGGGTKRGLGGITETEDILLSLSNYKGIIEHSVGDMTITVRAGTPFKELQDYLAQHNQIIPLDPSWPQNATVGGVVAANDNGPKRLGYGAARDVVIGFRIVYPNGSVIRSGGKVVKNVAGYDMNKLFIGSMGTLGVLSEVTLKLRPLPVYESLVLLSFPEGNLEEIKSFAVQVLDSTLEPTSFELVNPLLSERLTGQKSYTIAISLEDVKSSVHYQEDYLKSVKPKNASMNIYEKEKAQQFWEQFYKIGPNGNKEVSSNKVKTALKIGVVNLDVLHILRESELLQDSNNLLVESHGGLGHGLCQIHIDGTGDDVLIAIKQLREVAVKLGGYLIVKHLPLSLRQKVSVWGEKPSHFFLIEGIKLKADPNRILNPKRFIGGI